MISIDRHPLNKDISNIVLVMLRDFREGEGIGRGGGLAGSGLGWWEFDVLLVATVNAVSPRVVTP